MNGATRILLQTTITRDEDDWHIGRFGILAAFLAGLPNIEVVARDREAPGGETDPVLGSIEAAGFHQLWLFAVDTGGGLNKEECAAIERFRKSGGGMLVARDHMDLGSSVCTLGGVGDAHHFHSVNPEPDEDRRVNDDPFTTDILWPNYHSGANGDFQLVSPSGELHPVLRDAGGGPITRLPAHPHEGAVGAPRGDPTARVIAIGTSRVTGVPFNLAVAFERSGDGGPAVAQSTFHHFCDYNLDPRAGAPSFVSEAPRDGMLRDPEAGRQARRYFRNVAEWLAA